VCSRLQQQAAAAASAASAATAAAAAAATSAAEDSSSSSDSSHIVGLRKGVCCTAIICEILFVTVEYSHWTVAQRPQSIFKLKKLATYHIRFCILGMKSI
jgi:hypothetical protein